MTMTRIAVLCAVALSFVACGDNDDDDNDANNDSSDESALTLSVDNASLTLAAGETKTATVTVKRPSSVSSAAALSVSGAPSDVTVTVDPASTTDTATVTIATTASTAAASFTVSVVAVADTLAAAANIAVTVGQASAITVNGRFLNSIGTIIVPTAVSIWGLDATTAVSATLAADGTFSAANIVPPYDVRADLTGGGRVLYLGLSVAAPHLLASFSSSSYSTGITVKGDLSTSAPADSSTHVSATCPDSSGTTTTSGTSYTVELSGTVGTDLSCTVEVMRGSYDDDGVPTGWLAYASQPFTASTSTPVTVNFSLGDGPIASHSVQFDIDTSLGQSEAVLYWTPNDAGTVSAGSLLAGKSFVLPDDHAFTVYAQGYGANSVWVEVVPIASSATAVQVTPVPVLVFDDIADGVDADDVKFTPFSSAPATFLYYVESVTDDWLIASATSVDAARLAARELTFQDDTEYTAYGYAFFSQPNIDDFASLESFQHLYVTGMTVRYLEVSDFTTAAASP